MKREITELINQMQPASVGGSSELNRSAGSGLARFRSAPANWLEALLESEEEPSENVLDPPLLSSSKPPPVPPNSATGTSTSQYDTDLSLLETISSGPSPGLSNFLRQNSSPAKFLSQINTDGYFPSFGIPEYTSPSLVNVPPGNWALEVEDADKISPKLSSSSQQRGEKRGLVHSFDAETEKLLEDSVMCRTRAKRGCATHPRSIAERVRRTRISDRIRKLQELVPDMDKVFNDKLPHGCILFQLFAN
ncbi:transcription factor bHLH80-like isoform X2 [Olea europaea var. sylvestris]|uniref:transcription factor bHLH80-like isoform X2 n=1 Tax=Olea europaea var. sylvestris TaxID=158386 RepID=UPI000C1CFFF5|nr:transcription factor bHLH80-like isoform X2 [Olea europaea var. sylvestris]